MKVHHPLSIAAIGAVAIGVSIFTKDWILEQPVAEDLAAAFGAENSQADEGSGSGDELMEILEELDDGSTLPEDDPRLALQGLAGEIESGQGSSARNEEEEEKLASEESEGDKPPGEETELGVLARSSLVAAKILANQRFIDPFGMAMDPANRSEIAIIAESFEETEETPVLNNSSLKIAVGKLPITGVYPKRQMVVVGPRSFSPGDELGLRAEGLTIRLRFEGIREHSVYFRDVETNEVTSIDYNTRPVEFEPIAPGGRREPGQGIEAMTGLFIAN